jgi:hypothetical protein
MSENASKKIDRLIESDNRDLRFIFNKINRLNEINQKVTDYLPENLRSFCQVANAVGDKLILLVANGSIATQLRFDSENLIKHFKKDASLSHINAIELKVRPPQPSLPPRLSKAPERYAQPLSPITAQIIRDSAESLDPALREIMERIAGRIKT